MYSQEPRYGAVQKFERSFFNMKKLICLAIAAIMILSMIPVMAISTSAAVEGDWNVLRNPQTYEDEAKGEIVVPAPGYEYTSEGLMTISPDFSNYTPFFTVQTKLAQSLKDGIYLEFRVDDYPYGGEDGAADHWLSFNLSDRENVAPGNIDFGNNWLCLIRGAGEGSAAVQSFVTTKTTEEAVGSFGHKGDVNATVPMDAEGRETYSLEITYDGTNYDIKVCGVSVMGAADITAKLNEWNANGEFFVGITVHAGVKDASAGITVTKFGTSADSATVPVGDDSRQPEDNKLVFGELIDPTTIPENTPALMWDATMTSFKNDPQGVDLKLTAQGDNSYHLEAVGPAPYFQWSIKSELTVNQSDFPVFAMLMKNFWGDQGGIYYCSGDIMSCRDDYKIDWSIYDEGCQFYGEDDEYILVVVDMAALELIDETNSGRIHNIRPFFSVTDTTDLEMCQWDMCYMGYFRSIEEAQAYTAARLNMEATTEEPTEEKTEAPTDDTTAAPDIDTTAAPEAGETTATPDAGETTAAEKSGCSSVIGFSAVAILAAAAAAVALKKD